MGPLWRETGDLVTRDMEKIEVFALAFTSKCSKLQPALAEDVPDRGWGVGK